ncbi:MAG: response regulator [Lachnospiraceae bacterium]|nr:response regulator [Lachnospiraceae bacterium]
MKLLITDDEYATRNSIKHLIDRKRTGIDFICEAENFEEAITQIIHHSPEIIITDIVMPLHDGIYLMDWILQHSSHSKIIAVSGHDDFHFVKSTIQKGGIDYLLKPLDMEELNRALSHAAKQYQKEQEYHSLKKQNDTAEASETLLPCHPVILEVQRYIKEHFTGHLRQQDIADHFYINKDYLSRKFKQEFQISMVDYINRLRIDKAKKLLSVPGIKIAEVSEMVGFSDDKYFSTVFKRTCGISPKSYYLTHAEKEGNSALLL